MPQKVLETILTALEKFDGDKEQIENARLWLLNYFAENYQEDHQELAEINAAIAKNEAEEAKAIGVSHEEMVSRSLEKIVKAFI
jgi:hypothetical protein